MYQDTSRSGWFCTQNSECEQDEDLSYKTSRLAQVIHFLYQDSTPKGTSTSQRAPSAMDQMFETMSLGKRAFYTQSATEFFITSKFYSCVEFEINKRYDEMPLTLSAFPVLALWYLLLLFTPPPTLLCSSPVYSQFPLKQAYLLSLTSG